MPQVASANRPSRLNLAAGNNRYRQKKSKPKQVTVSWIKFGRLFTVGLYTTLAISFFLAASLGLLAAYRWMTHWDYFALQQIEVRGARFQSQEQVLAAAGVALGDNILQLNMQETEELLRNNPWVRGVALKRELPHSLSIVIEEREPRFWKLHGEALYFADADGRAIAPVGTEAFRALPMLYLDEGMESLLPVFHAFSTRAKALHSGFNPSHAAWVRVKSDMSIELYMESRDLLVTLDTRNWELNLDCLRQTWNDLVRRGEHESVRALSAHGAKVWVTRS